MVDRVAPSEHGSAPRLEAPTNEPLGEAFTPQRPRAPIAPAWTRALVAEPAELPPSADEHWDDELLVDDQAVEAAEPSKNGVHAPTDSTADVAPVTVAQSIEALVKSRTPTPEKKAAPIGAVKPAPAPKVRRRSTPDPEAIDRIAPLAEVQPIAPPQTPVAPDQIASAPPKAPIAPAPVAKPAPAGPPKARGASTPAVAAQPVAASQPAVAAAPAVAAQPAAKPVPATPRPRREPAPPSPAVLGLALAQPAVSAPPPKPAAAPAPRFEPRREPDPRLDPTPREAPVPAWPPPGDRGPLAEPVGRVPAGLYLPPSAVLPSGESLPLPGSTNGRKPDEAGASAATSSDQASERLSAADRLSRLEIPADWPRRVVAIGAVIASLGFVLPWTASPVGNDLLGDYWIRWGLAGPGAWILVAVLVGLAAVTLAGGRLATAPVGLPGVALAMLLLGLAWPYLFGFPERGVGVWVVLSGVFLLAIGGLLDMRAGRHHDPHPTV